jgi:hypothetical protein
VANLRRVKSESSRRHDQGGSGSRTPRPIPDGTELFETSTGRRGEVLEHACQYAYPQADPVYHYLIRWDDGQVQALGEAAIGSGRGVELGG